ncbi:hypothetical protein CHU98_g8040 [Xylaria longipes]|nr:hypothetical protein CHU98_g8040 [Xylaria longipes]
MGNISALLAIPDRGAQLFCSSQTQDGMLATPSMLGEMTMLYRLGSLTDGRFPDKAGRLLTYVTWRRRQFISYLVDVPCTPPTPMLSAHAVCNASDGVTTSEAVGSMAHASPYRYDAVHIACMPATFLGHGAANRNNAVVGRALLLLVKLLRIASQEGIAIVIIHGSGLLLILPTSCTGFSKRGDRLD